MFLAGPGVLAAGQLILPLTRGETKVASCGYRPYTQGHGDHQDCTGGSWLGVFVVLFCGLFALTGKWAFIGFIPMALRVVIGFLRGCGGAPLRAGDAVTLDLGTQKGKGHVFHRLFLVSMSRRGVWRMRASDADDATERSFYGAGGQLHKGHAWTPPSRGRGGSGGGGTRSSREAWRFRQGPLQQAMARGAAPAIRPAGSGARAAAVHPGTTAPV